MPIEPMRSRRLFIRQRPRRENAKLAIDLKRIGVDDDTVHLPRHVQRQGGLAAGGRSCNKQRALLRCLAHMDSVLVLIAASGSKAIGRNVLDLLRALGAGEPHWLAEGEAAEFHDFERLPEFMVDIRHFPIDAAVVSIHNRRKRILIADMDSTMIEQECIDELGTVAGAGPRIKAITLRAMRGELDFDAALRERVALLKGLDAAIIARIIRERITYVPGGATLIATMKANGAYTALVSGGFVQFTSRVAGTLGFDEHQALSSRLAARRAGATAPGRSRSGTRLHGRAAR